MSKLTQIVKERNYGAFMKTVQTYPCISVNSIVFHKKERKNLYRKLCWNWSAYTTETLCAGTYIEIGVLSQGYDAAGSGAGVQGEWATPKEAGGRQLVSNYLFKYLCLS